jgi:hypothetical protein
MTIPDEAISVTSHDDFVGRELFFAFWEASWEGARSALIKWLSFVGARTNQI